MTAPHDAPAPGPVDGAIIVDGRNTKRHLAVLGMECDAKEIPQVPGQPRLGDWWIAESAGFEGQAQPGGASGQLGPAGECTAQGTVAMVVASDRLLAIVSPNDVRQPALWLAVGCPSITALTSGSAGRLKKRPTTITLQLPGGQLQLERVGRLFRSSKRLQANQEQSFLKALVAATAEVRSS